jgi:hypothetical protein
MDEPLVRWLAWMGLTVLALGFVRLTIATLDWISRRIR